MLTNNGYGGGGCLNPGGGCERRGGGDGFKGPVANYPWVKHVGYEVVFAVVEVLKERMKRSNRCSYLRWILMMHEVVKEIYFLEAEKVFFHCGVHHLRIQGRALLQDLGERLVLGKSPLSEGENSDKEDEGNRHVVHSFDYEVGRWNGLPTSKKYNIKAMDA
ncbi:hypothetical protein Tco_1035400 [Tanacetum coccineum]